MHLDSRCLVRRLELHQMEKVTSNGAGSAMAGANGKLCVKLWIQLPGSQHWETKLPGISGIGFFSAFSRTCPSSARFTRGFRFHLISGSRNSFGRGFPNKETAEWSWRCGSQVTIRVCLSCGCGTTSYPNHMSRAVVSGSNPAAGSSN